MLELKIALNNRNEGPTITNFDALIISLDIWSKPVDLLLARLETPYKNSLRVKGLPSSDSYLSQLLSM